MAKKNTAPQAPMDKDLVAFVEVIKPAELTPANQAALIHIAGSFLESLNQRHAQAQTRVDAALKAAIKGFVNSKTGLPEVNSKEDADEAASVCNDLAQIDKEISESWEKETAFFFRFHKTLTSRKKELHDALDGMIRKLKGANSLWLQREHAKIEAAQAKAQEIVGPDAPAPVFDTPKIKGMSDRKVWKYKPVNLMDLVKAVAKGKISTMAVQVNDQWLSRDVQNNHAAAEVVEENGKKRYFLYDRTVEIYEDIHMARR